MNSFRYRRTPSGTKTLLALATALAAVTLAMPASAQQQGAPVFLDAPNSPDGFPAADRAPVVRLPEGASISDAQDKVRSMATEAGRSLDELIGSAVTPRAEAEVGEMAARQRRIMVLEDQLKEAKLARELWVELNGEEDSEATKAEIERLHSEKESLHDEIYRLMSMQATQPVEDADPVVSEVTGAAGRMRAKILVPYVGEVMVEPGMMLPNGMRVEGIGRTGVKVSKGDISRTLAFGNSVPMRRIGPMVQQQPAQR